MFARVLIALFLTVALPLGPAMAEGEGRARILMMGDSLFAMHKLAGRSVGATLRATLAEPVVDGSVAGARHVYRLPISGALGLNIAKQFRHGNWDWVVINGGGNDLLFGCGCSRCDARLDRMISRSGRYGVIPGLVSRLRHYGAQVIYVGYLRSPGVSSPIEHCADEGNELNSRLARLAAMDRGVHFLPLSDMVPHGDLSYHALDRIHPSIKASRAIGQRIAKLIASVEGQPAVSRNAMSAD